MRLSEKYRPTCLDEILAQDKAKTIIRTITARGWGGRAWWITGKSGQGKTSLARIIAAMGADPLNTREVVARQVTPTMIADLVHNWAYVAMGEKPGYALIINESHGLTKPVIEILLDVLENLRDTVSIIFTTTRDGNDLFEEHMDAGPFASRCIQLNLTPRGLADVFAKRLREIALAENLDGKPPKAYLELVKQTGNNFRECLQHIENGEMIG